MELNEYQKRAMETCMPSSNNFAYMMLNLVGEVGEFASKVAKAIRKGQMDVSYNGICATPSVSMDEVINLMEELKKEAGDIMWQLFGLLSAMGWEPERIAQMNLDKLAARKANNTIDGSGDGVTKEERGV